MTNNRRSDEDDALECPIESSTECPTCDGTGIIYPLPFKGFDVSGVINCPDCDGTGVIYR